MIQVVLAWLLLYLSVGVVMLGTTLMLVSVAELLIRRGPWQFWVSALMLVLCGVVGYVTIHVFTR